jgi:hypothetical protein
VQKQQSIYTFIEPFLETGTVDEIEAAKKKYWQEYRKKWNKQKRKEQKEIAVFYTTKEFQVIEAIAKKYRLSCSGFIKKSSLAICQKQSLVHNQEEMNDIKIILAKSYNSIQALSDENNISEQTGEKLMAKIESLEIAIMEKLQRQVDLEELVVKTVTSNPEAKKVLTDLLQKL